MSRTHRVELDSLYDWINLDPKIQIKYVDNKKQLADMLTKGNCTRDEWNHLLRWFKIMNFSMFSCSHFLSIQKPNAQERRTGEELVLAKSKPVSLMPRRLSANQSLTLDSGISYTSTQKSGRERNENSASSSQVWHRDDNLFPSTERSGREMNQRSSNRKQRREVQNQLTEVKLNHHNLEISPILDTLRKSSRMFDKS